MMNNSNRYFWFVLSIVTGFFLGGVYGWFLSPAHSTETSVDKLRYDYKADYVLMVAEALQNDQNVMLAKSRLTILGNNNTLQTVTEAIGDAQKLMYAQRDLDLMYQLSKALQATPQAFTATPTRTSMPTFVLSPTPTGKIP